MAWWHGFNSSVARINKSWRWAGSETPFAVTPETLCVSSISSSSTGVKCPAVNPHREVQASRFEKNKKWLLKWQGMFASICWPSMINVDSQSQSNLTHCLFGITNSSGKSIYFHLFATAIIARGVELHHAHLVTVAQTPGITTTYESLWTSVTHTAALYTQATQSLPSHFTHIKIHSFFLFFLLFFPCISFRFSFVIPPLSPEWLILQLQQP